MSNKVTLTGYFTLLDGTPAEGTVLIRPSRSPILDLEGKQVISGPQRFTLDEEGRFSVDLPPTDDPALGEPFTYHVMVSMHHTNWQVIGLTLPVEMISVDVLDPPAGVVKEYPTRAEWDALTEAAVAEMESALDGAETARDTTLEARDTAMVARDETVTARDETLTARDTAVGAAGEAETARTETHTARDATLTARDTTLEARDATFTARTETTTATGVAESARDTAVGAASDAETARDEAVGAADDAETARLSAWEAVDTPGRQGPPGEVTTAALTTALAGKVSGTGMTLRHDNSVGERVFLDHPGGSTMLYGDTGWRNVPDSMLAITTGGVRVCFRRHGATVYLSADLLNLAEPHSQNTDFIALPEGFGPGSRAVRVGSGATYELSAATYSSGEVLRTRERVETGSRRFYMQWTTTAPWPTVLPGTPA